MDEAIANEHDISTSSRSGSCESHGYAVYETLKPCQYQFDFQQENNNNNENQWDVLERNRHRMGQ